MRRIAIMALLLAVMAGGCEDNADDGIGIDATGTVQTLVWVDLNGNGALETLDAPAPGVRLLLLAPIGGDALYSRATGPNGELTLSPVMVGDYRVALDAATVGDTLQILPVDSSSITVAAGDTTAFAIGLTFPFATTDSVRVAPIDRRFFVEGEVISDWDAFGDGSIHIRDETGAIRAVRVQATSATLGDSVRLFGAASAQAGRPVLKDAIVFLLETGVESPEPIDVTTGEAADAAAGERDADLVRVLSAIVQDTLRNSFNEFVLRVDDGSGPLDIVLDRDIPFFLNVPQDAILGSSVDASGILLPPASGAAGTWVLKPRENPDIQIQTP